MKFAKELDESAVPEWKEKYLNYKQGKKKLKAVARAVRTVDRTPASQKQPTPLGNSLRDAPVYLFLNRKETEASNPAAQHSGRRNSDRRASNAPLFPVRSRSEAIRQLEQDGDRTPRPSGRPLLMNERSPLRGAVAERDETAKKERQGMTRYGSIIGSPPSGDSPVMQQLDREASLLELPDPALDPEQPKNVQRRDFQRPSTDTTNDRAISPGSPELSKSMHAPSGQLGHTGNAYDPAKKPRDVPPNSKLPARYGSIFQPKRVNSMPGDSRPFMKRMFSLAGPPTPGSGRRDNDVALEAYREVDFRQAEFFLFLDKELDKIETFYKSKEDEATQRLQKLREQLHVMRNQRLSEVVEAEQRKRHEASNGALSGILPNGNSKDDEGSERPSTRQSHRRVSSAPWLASVDHAVDHIDDALHNLKTGKVGKTSKAMGELGTPNFPAFRANPDNKDYSRRPAQKDVPYRVAKRKLKIALAEYYRGLELLKSYALLNRTAYRKINKKFDKTVNARPSGRYMSEKINKAHFVTSEILDGHIQAVEDLYARYFERGNHKVAVGKLRAKIARAGDYTGSVWRQAVLASTGAVLGIEGVVYGAELLWDPDPARQVQTSYLLQIYAGYFLLLFLVGLFVVNARAFSRAKVNYQFIFEFDTRHTLDWRQLSEMPALFTFLLGLTMWLNFHPSAPDSGQAMYIYWPVVLIAVSALILFWPAPGFYHRSRGWFLYSNWRLLLAGLYPVEFRDFFLGDMYCSQTYAMGQIEVFFCLYAHYWHDPPQCNSNHSRLLGFFSCLPGIWRALQCLRRYGDTRNVFPHLVNCGKYTFTILSYMSISLFRIDRTYSLKAFFIFCCTINSIYCSIWDVVMDWSLGDPYARKPFLRQTLAYKSAWWYYLAMFLDPILRFNWIFYAIYADDIQHSSVVSFCVAFSEVCRRGMWTLFRVENEHCTNVGRFRASRDVPLPYDIADESRESLISKKSDRLPMIDGTPNAPKPQNGTGDERAASGPPSPELSHQTSRTTARDLESQGHLDNPSLRMRRRHSLATADSPVARALRKAASTMLNAHAQDYERKRRPEMEAESGQQDSDDEDGERSSDSDDDNVKKAAKAFTAAGRRGRGKRKGDRHDDTEAGSGSEGEDGGDMARVETEGQERSRAEMSEAVDALERAGQHRNRT